MGESAQLCVCFMCHRYQSIFGLSNWFNRDREQSMLFQKIKDFTVLLLRVGFFLLRRSYLKNTIFFNDWKQNIEKFRNKIIELLLSPEKTTTHLIEAQLVFQDFGVFSPIVSFLKRFSCFQSRFLVGWQHPVGIDLMVKGRRG